MKKKQDSNPDPDPALFKLCYGTDYLQQEIFVKNIPVPKKLINWKIPLMDFSAQYRAGTYCIYTKKITYISIL
jgi:hypothetical protein